MLLNRLGSDREEKKMKYVRQDVSSKIFSVYDVLPIDIIIWYKDICIIGMCC